MIKYQIEVGERQIQKLEVERIMSVVVLKMFPLPHTWNTYIFIASNLATYLIIHPTILPGNNINDVFLGPGQKCLRS